MQGFSGTHEHYTLEGKKVRFLLSPVRTIPAWLWVLPRPLVSPRAVFPSRHVQQDACPHSHTFRFVWISMCGPAGFWVLVFELGLMAAAQRAERGWLKPQDMADNAASHIGAMLLLGAGSHRLLLVPGPGSQ